MTWWEKLVSEYAGISLLDVNELDYIDYLILKRDAFIYRLNKTADGQEYLRKAWTLEQTKPDRKKLKSRFGNGGI